MSQFFAFQDSKPALISGFDWFFDTLWIRCVHGQYWGCAPPTHFFRFQKGNGKENQGCLSLPCFNLCEPTWKQHIHSTALEVPLSTVLAQDHKLCFFLSWMLRSSIVSSSKDNIPKNLSALTLFTGCMIAHTVQLDFFLRFVFFV